MSRIFTSAPENPATLDLWRERPDCPFTNDRRGDAERPSGPRGSGLAVLMTACLALVVCAAAAPAAEPRAPVGVSPGAADRYVVSAGRCPTFSWSGGGDSAALELLIYRIEEAGTAEVALSVALPPGATSWTPTADQCLSPGQWAWSVRSPDAAASEPLLLAISPRPSQAELERALAVVRAWQEARTDVGPESASVGGIESSRSSSEPEPNESKRRRAQTAVAASLTGAEAGIWATSPSDTGRSHGVVGVSDSSDGAGVWAENGSSGGADLVLGGTSPAALSETGLSRSSSTDLAFEFANTGTGAMSLSIDGVDVVTTDLDQDTLGALGCGEGEIAKLVSGVWTCAADSDTAYRAGNQLDLSGSTFDVLEGPRSGLDADTVDGQHASAFMAAGTDAWVDEAGDTMSGDLVLSGSTTDLVLDGDVVKAGVPFLHAEGSTNLGVGIQSLASLTSGTENVAVGSQALAAADTGVENTAVGNDALAGSTGSRNTGVGASALAATSSGQFNTAVGALALKTNTGAWNTAVGSEALSSNDGANVNTAVGADALRDTVDGSGNTAVGHNALELNVSGHSNTAVGQDALAESTGDGNTALGRDAGAKLTTGHSNTLVGEDALPVLTSGFRMTAVGHETLFSLTDGDSNTAFGDQALYALSTGSGNTAIGEDALNSLTDGLDNIALGTHAGGIIESGSDNIMIGNAGSASDSNTIRIGDSAHSDTYVAGIYGATASPGAAVYVDSDGKLGTKTSSRRFKEEIRTLGEVTERLFDLRPVAFRYRSEVVGRAEPRQEYGLIAEEVEKVFPELVIYDEDGRPLTVRYDALSTLLLAELDENRRRIEELEAALDKAP